MVGVLLIAVVLTVLGIRFGILLGGLLGRRLERDDEEEPSGPAA
jgi:hypothetical protein